MQNYTYIAKDNYGKQMRGIMTAENEIDLANKVSNLGYFLVRAKVSTGYQVEAGRKIAKMEQREVLNFSIHLATLLDAGVPLVAALRELSRDEQKEKVRKIIEDIRYRVESGTSLKEALASHPWSFSKLFISIVGAGEGTGKLPSSLSELTNLLDWQLELQSNVKEAATYPVILFFVMVTVTLLLVVKVIPTFETIFKEMGVALPLPTQIILEVSHFVRNFWYLILGIFIAFVVSYKVCDSIPKTKYMLDSLKLKLPLFGALLSKISLSRFCHTFALALKSGINVLPALDISLGVIGNTRLEYFVVKVREAVNVGEKLATAFQASKEFPPLVVRMIAVGEQSGALAQSLDKVNQFYDREVPVTIKRMFGIFEPLMIVVMATIVGGIAIAIFLPMFKMAEVIGS